VAEGAGRCGGIPSSDYDLVVYLTNEIANFEPVLEKLKRKLEGLQGFKYEMTKPYSIQFKLNGLTFDLLPVITFIPGILGPPPAYTAQLSEMLLRAKGIIGIGIQDLFNDYSSCLPEFAVEFSYRQTETMQTVLRLANFWDKMVDLGGTVISTRSKIIEVVAIASNQACKKKAGGNGKSVLTCFTRFLISMTHFSGLNVRHYVPGSVHPEARGLRRLPFILDPENSNHNLTHDMTPETMKLFEAAAVRTLEKIEALYLNEVNPDIMDLIDPRVN